MSTMEVTELLGDGIGPELRESVYSLANALPLDLKFIPFDLSVENGSPEKAGICSIRSMSR